MQYNDGVDRLTVGRWSSCAVAAAVTVAIYAGAWDGDFQFDDALSILENPHLERWRTFVGHLDHMVRPVLYATLFVDRSFYGHSATGYHALNLLLHLGAGFLIHRILSRAVTEKWRHVPFWTALLFLIHPIQTEVVTYISGRASGLMGFFYLLALALYVKGTASQPGEARSRGYLLGALLAFVLALGSKETAMTFPLALVLWDVLIRRFDRVAFRKRFVPNHLPFWLVLLVAAAWAWWHPRYSALAQFSFDLRPFSDNLLSELNAVGYALGLFFCPWKQTFDHDLPLLRSPFEWPLPLVCFLLGALATAAVVTMRRFPLLAFGLAWYVVQVLPTALVPRNDLLSERNLYLASMGILLAVVVLASLLTSWLVDVLQRPKLVHLVAGSLTAAVVLALCLATVQRNALYRDPLLLWSDAVAKAPQKARPHNNLGHVYAERGHWQLAIEHFRIASKLDPEYWIAQDNLRDAYLHQAGRR